MRKYIGFLGIGIITSLFISINVFAEENTSIPDDAVELDGHYYKVFNTYKSWEEAEVYCESLSGHLAIIDSENKQLFIESLIENESPNLYWIGANCKNGDWCWINGAKLDFENWAYNEPSGIDGNGQGLEEKYMQIYAKQYKNNNFGEWNDINLYGDEKSVNNFYSLQNTGFICEWDSKMISKDLNDNLVGINQNNNDISVIENMDNAKGEYQDSENIENNKEIDKKINLIFNISIFGSIIEIGGISLIGTIIKSNKKDKNG